MNIDEIIRTATSHGGLEAIKNMGYSEVPLIVEELAYLVSEQEDTLMELKKLPEPVPQVVERPVREIIADEMWREVQNILKLTAEDFPVNTKTYQVAEACMKLLTRQVLTGEAVKDPMPWYGRVI